MNQITEAGQATTMIIHGPTTGAATTDAEIGKATPSTAGTAMRAILGGMKVMIVVAMTVTLMAATTPITAAGPDAGMARVAATAILTVVLVARHDLPSVIMAPRSLLHQPISDGQFPQETCLFQAHLSCPSTAAGPIRADAKQAGPDEAHARPGSLGSGPIEWQATI